MFPTLDDVLSTLSQSLTDAQRSLRHLDVIDDDVHMKQSTPAPDNALIINNPAPGILVITLFINMPRP